MLDVAAQRPRFSAADAQRIAREQFGRQPVTVRPLPSDRDQNFYLEEASGTACVLKIASAAEEEAVLDLQNQALLHLAAHHSSPAAFPKPLATHHSSLITRHPPHATPQAHFVRLLTFLPGVPLARVKPHTPELLNQAGHFLASLDAALLDFNHPTMRRELHWDLRHAATVTNRRLPLIANHEKRALLTLFLERYTREVEPQLSQLRCSVIHNDGNDHNLLVSSDAKAPRRIVGLVDFGDMVYSCTVFEAAVAAAYLMLDKPDPLAGAAQFIAGYHAVLPLTELELELLPTLIALRLCASVAISAHQQSQEPDDPYLSISERPAWDLLRRLARISPRLFHYTLRGACGLTPYPGQEKLASWLRENRTQVALLLPVDVATADVLDLSVGGGATTGGRPYTPSIGRYNEARFLDPAAAFRTDDGEPRTIHLGLDLFMPAGTSVRAPITGTVHDVQIHEGGATAILQHQPAPELTFFTLYGRLGPASLNNLKAGMVIQQGGVIGRIGDVPAGDPLPAHLHFQIAGDLLDAQGRFASMAPASQRDVWLSLCPDPNLLLGIPASRFPPPPMSGTAILSAREEHLGPSLSISYQKPLHILRGWRQYLYDENGRAYLDVVNNVCHVGHSHPHVVGALARQAAVLNTNTRYLHPTIVRYAERLLATLPAPLEVCFFVCSGSEANELALRLARTYTGAEDMIVVDGAYHGNTAALIDISPYKHDGPGGRGAPPHVHTVLMPDPYRGRYKGYGSESGERYAAPVRDAAAAIQGQDRGVAAFICESLLGCGGQIVLPDGYLQEAFRYVRAAGGVCIADEVQVGFGRVGTHFWGFETQGVVPDIVTMGKPIGNGHPLAAVATTRAIADAFANGMEYFNTFGGNPVSCAVGSAVLDVIEEEQLQEQARQVGAHLLQGLTGLMDRHPLIGDVRGLGLFVGIELVHDHQSLRPAPAEATYIVERMKEHGILLSIDGPLHNVLKLKPPLLFDHDNADFLVATLDKVLAEDAAQPVARETE